MNQNEFLYPLSELINEGRREDAYIWFREHQSHFSARERRLIRAVIAGRLWRAPVLLAVITLGLQAVAGSIFENQLQDMFSFLGEVFRPYMYVASVLPLVVNLILAAVLLIQCYERLVLTFRMLGVRPPWKRVGTICSIALLLAGWSAYSLVPYAQDLPFVMAGNWPTGIVTREQEEATAKNNVLVQMGREPEGEFDPIPWCSSPRWPDWLMPVMPGLYNRWVCDIHVDDVTCRIGRLQFDLTGYQANVYPVRVEYLPHSRLVLWISCGEGESQ